MHIVAGLAYFTVVEPPDQVLRELRGCLTPRGSLASTKDVATFSDDVREKLTEVRAVALAIARPLRYSNWQYADAFARAALETCFMLEAHRLSIHYQAIGQQHAANVLGIPLDRLDDALAAKLDIEKSSWRREQFPSLLVGLALAAQISPPTTRGSARARPRRESSRRVP